MFNEIFIERELVVFETADMYLKKRESHAVKS
jgi:hypothetical protein